MEIKSTQEDRYRYWRTLLEEQENSNLSQVEFCRQKELTMSQFTYYRSLLKPRVSNSNSDMFKPIQLKSNDEAFINAIKIITPNGFQCLFPNDISSKKIKELLEVLLLC